MTNRKVDQSVRKEKKLEGNFKDSTMAAMPEKGFNIANFVSFAPDGTERYCRIHGFDHARIFESPEDAVRTMYELGIELVNVRTFLPDKPEGNPFFLGGAHGFEDPVKVAVCVVEMLSEGYYVIINENIDPSDGGVSGVAFGDVVEFAPCETPRCVERVDDLPCAILSRDKFRRMVEEIYGFKPVFPFPTTHRIEFSVHPGPVGYYDKKMVIWQAEKMPGAERKEVPFPLWPNRMSANMGDKAYGLLMAHLYDLPVPHTEVIGRVIPPFSFGQPMNSGHGIWIRTCPRKQEPGRYETVKGMTDLFAMMETEDPTGKKIASLIAQEGVPTEFSGVVLTNTHGEAVLEGKAGRGDTFMIGEKLPTELPESAIVGAQSLWGELYRIFGPIRLEWVHDGTRAWIVQLNLGETKSEGIIIVPGEAKSWQTFVFDHNNAKNSLEKLRELAETLKGKDVGIILVGNMSQVSHPPDILRLAKIPSRIERPNS